MFVTPGTTPDIGHKLTRKAAEQVARNWSLLLLNGALLVVAGFLIFSIDWTIRELATFIGALFIFQGVAEALTDRHRRTRPPRQRGHRPALDRRPASRSSSGRARACSRSRSSSAPG